MADQLRICSWYLEGLRDNIRAANLGLMQGSSVPRGANLEVAGEVDAAYDWLAGKWDEHRNQLTEHLSALDQALSKVIESFTETDAALAQPDGGTA